MAAALLVINFIAGDISIAFELQRNLIYPDPVKLRIKNPKLSDQVRTITLK